MLKYFLILFAVSVSAVEFTNLTPGQSLIPKVHDETRAKLFVDAKPASDALFRPTRRNSPMELAVTATDKETIQITIPKERKLPFTGDINMALDQPGTQYSFSIRFENFQQGKGNTNNLFFLIGGAHLMFRGDTADIRYFDGNADKYVVLKKLNQEQWHDFVIEVNQDKFSLNDMKGIRLRGTPTLPKMIQINSKLNLNDNGKAPVILIKNLKVK